MLNTQVAGVVFVVFFSKVVQSTVVPRPLLSFTELTVCNAGKKPFLYIRIVLTAIFYFICEDDPVLKIVKNFSNVLGIQGGMGYASRIILEQEKKSL